MNNTHRKSMHIIRVSYDDLIASRHPHFEPIKHRVSRNRPKADLLL